VSRLLTYWASPAVHHSPVKQVKADVLEIRGKARRGERYDILKLTPAVSLDPGTRRPGNRQLAQERDGLTEMRKVYDPQSHLDYRQQSRRRKKQACIAAISFL